MNRQQKEAAVGELVNEFGEAEAVYAVDYRGLSVAQISELRARLLQNDTKLKVVKNSVTKLAAEQAEVTSINDELSGPTALAFVRGDVRGASLDHAIWFHEDARADDWLLYAMESPWSGHARGLNFGRVFTRDGRLVASTAQEGMFRAVAR